MAKGFTCRYCGKEKPWEERDYDIGCFLARTASQEALGHTEYVVPYLICEECSANIKNELEINGWRDEI